MIALRPSLRLFRREGRVFLEALARERAIEADTLLVDVVRALSLGPVDGSAELCARLGDVDKREVHARLSVLSGLGLVRTTTTEDAPGAVFAELARGLPAFPVVDQVELTNVCPMACVMCPTGTGRMTRAQGYMDGALFRRLVDEIAAAGVQRAHGKPLTLHNLGESLLHDELPDFVRYAHDVGLATEVSGNPGHLAPALFAKLEDAGLARIVLDVDGMDADTLTAIRGRGARADRAFAWLDEILAARRARPTFTTEIVIQMIEQPKNAHHLAAFRARYVDDAPPGVIAYVKTLDANTTRSAGLAIVDDTPTKQYLCRAPYKSVVVLWDGTVVACCHDPNGALPLGSARTSTLAEIWRGREVAALRERLATGTCTDDEPCGDCAHRADRFRLPPLDRVPDEPLAW